MRILTNCNAVPATATPTALDLPGSSPETLVTLAKTGTISISLHGEEENVDRICGHWTSDFATKQIAEYTVDNGLATIYSLRPVICTQVHLPFPFLVPVNDLGSGQLVSIEINCDTLRAHEAVCPTTAWAERRQLTPPRTIPQQLIADYCALL